MGQKRPTQIRNIMQIALIILKSGIELVTMAEQLEEEPSCHMQDPYLIKEDGTLEPWPRSQQILTYCFILKLLLQ